MSFPTATPEQIAFYRDHGWLVVKDAIPQADLDVLEERCDKIIREKERFAFDWAWDAKEKREERTFRIIQSSPSLVWDTIAQQPYRKWLTEFSGALMDMKMDLFLDMLLAKPPEKSVPTYWHQDEGYWGRNLADRGITCWIPLHDVDARNGCMHFIDGGHKDGILTHRIVDGVASDLLTCDVDEHRMVVCPIKRGDVTFHHSKTPHMTTANTSQRYRKAVTNHLEQAGAGGEGGHYHWKIYVDQRTGKVTVPERG